MRVYISRWTRLAVLGVVVSSVSTTGCSSGWKMPSMKMPWSKKPSEAALAGSGPSALTYPESPATKQVPNAIASNAAGKPATATPPGNSMAQVGGAKTSPAAYTAPSIGGSAPAGYKAPGAGTAATANGYATGPYNTFGQNGAASTLATAGAPAQPGAIPASQMVPGSPANTAGFAATNPYAQPAGAVGGMPASQAYGGMTPASYAGRPATAQAAPAPTSNTMGQFAAAGNPGGPGVAMPPAAPGPAGAHPSPAPSSAYPLNVPTVGGSYSAIGMAPPSNGGSNAFAQAGMTNPSANVGYPAPNTQASFGAPGSMGQVPAQTAGYSAPGAGNNYATAGYRPGSTSRSTGYNFAPQQSGAMPAGTPMTSGVPYTASGAGNAGYSLPPSSTLNR